MCALTAAILLSACGGGSSDSSTTKTAAGVFKDASVTGLGNHSGSRSGTTGENGEFTFEVGESITFSVGGVTIGTTEGAEVITPVDLGADNWNPVDFTSGDLGNELIAIASDVQSIDGDATVPSAAKAEDHFSGMLRCLTSGAFIGTFDGDRSGRFALLASASTGEVTGRGYNETASSVFTLTSNSAVNPDIRRRLVSRITSGGAEYSGSFDRSGNVPMAGRRPRSPATSQARVSRVTSTRTSGSPAPIRIGSPTGMPTSMPLISTAPMQPVSPTAS